MTQSKKQIAMEERIFKAADYMIANNATVRQTAEYVNVSKSTVHKDMTQRLPKLSVSVAKKVNTVLQKNKAERHLRGGLATKQKYLSQK